MSKVLSNISISVLFLVLLVACQARLGDGRPNFILIITDDQRWDTVGEYMPITQARIFDQGINFTRGYVTTPLCCPSRASILTGMYAHTHGVRTNQDLLLKTTFVERLHEAGYFTGLVGFYLNSWDGSIRPEFDFWVAFSPSTRPHDKYVNPTLNVNGSWKGHEGYSTHILRDYALRFLDEAMEKQQPFVLIFAPNAPHWPARPAPGDESFYKDLPPYRPPNYNEDNMSDKPAWMNSIPLIEGEVQVQLDAFRHRQLAAPRSLDEALGEILHLLEGEGRLDNSAIFYISDNGYFWGEHRLEGKGLVYEPAIRVPFALRYPRLVPQGRIEDRLVANIDIAPTIYQLAGLPVPPEVDGLSLIPLLEGSGDWRDELLIEGWPSLTEPDNRPYPYAAVHTGRYVYVETEGDLAELYDLEQDPYQLQNLAYDPAYAAVVTEMKERLQRLRGD